MTATEHPSAFREERVGPVRIRARREVLSWAVEAVENGWTLFDLAAEHPDRSVLQGRGPTWVMPAPRGGRGRWVVRHYRRGGWMAPLLGDRYLDRGVPRPFREMETSEAARARGVQTPRVAVGAVYGAGLFYRADLATELVPDSRDLAEALFPVGPRSLAGSVDRRDALRAAGELVRRMARAGLDHPDLNAKNVLLRWSGAAPDPYLVDLDRAVMIGGSGDESLARRMHRRLVRSLEKWEKKTGKGLSETDYEVLKAAVEEAW